MPDGEGVSGMDSLYAYLWRAVSIYVVVLCRGYGMHACIPPSPSLSPSYVMCAHWPARSAEPRTRAPTLAARGGLCSVT